MSQKKIGYSRILAGNASLRGQVATGASRTPVLPTKIPEEPKNRPNGKGIASSEALKAIPC